MGSFRFDANAVDVNIGLADAAGVVVFLLRNGTTITFGFGVFALLGVLAFYKSEGKICLRNG